MKKKLFPLIYRSKINIDDQSSTYHVNFPPPAFASLNGFLALTGVFKKPARKLLEQIFNFYSTIILYKNI